MRTIMVYIMTLLSMGLQAGSESMLLQQACDGGYAAKCYDLGILYQRGDNLPQDHVKAKALFQKACDGGDTRGCTELESKNSTVHDNAAHDTEEISSDYPEEETLTLQKREGLCGLVNEKGEWVVDPLFNEILVANPEGEYTDINGWIKVKQKDLWGVMDSGGRWIFKPQFEDISRFSANGLLTAKQHGKWGLIDTKGKWLFKPKFDDIHDYAENDATGFATVVLHGKYGLIDEEGKLLLAPKFTYDDIYAHVVLEDLYQLQKTGLLKRKNRYDKWGIVDREKKQILPQKFDEIKILDDRIYIKFCGQEGYATFDGKYLNHFEACEKRK